jgi:PEP-CTERM motif
MPPLVKSSRDSIYTRFVRTPDFARKCLFSWAVSIPARAVQCSGQRALDTESESTLSKQLIATLTLLAAAAGTQAAAVVGSTTLLTAAHAEQLQTWLGRGAITLTSIYTKKPGDTALDFHAAVDGKGATFTVMVVTGYIGVITNEAAYYPGIPSVSALIGGYNKDSWRTQRGDYGQNVFNYDFNLGDGDDNFIFNLTSGEKREQTREYSTNNWWEMGPTFGNGFDIHVDYSLNYGFQWAGSYGDSSISSPEIPDSEVAAIEVYTISAGVPRAEVPEPGTLALVGLALTAAGIARRCRA